MTPWEDRHRIPKRRTKRGQSLTLFRVCICRKDFFTKLRAFLKADPPLGIQQAAFFFQLGGCPPEFLLLVAEKGSSGGCLSIFLRRLDRNPIVIPWLSTNSRLLLQHLCALGYAPRADLPYRRCETNLSLFLTPLQNNDFFEEGHDFLVGGK